MSYDFIEDVSKDEEEISKISPKSKNTHLEAVEAMDMLQSYITSNNMPSDNGMTLHKLLWNFQIHDKKNPKKAPSITSFFAPWKYNNNRVNVLYG